MIKNISFRKVCLLPLFALLLWALAIQFAFFKTASAYRLNQQLNGQLLQSNDLSYQPGYMQRKDANLANIIKLYAVDSLTYHHNLLTSIAAIANKTEVKLIDMPVNDNNPYYRSSTYLIKKIRLEGSFYNLTRFVNEVQATSQIGRVRSLQYQTTNLRTATGSKKKLNLDIFLEVAVK